MLTDDRIAGILRSRISRSPSFLSGFLEKERQKVNDSYNGELPAPLHKGNSKYVSNDVFDSVESANSQLIETFGSSFNPVRFRPQGPEDVEAARIDTEAVNFVVDRQNDGFGVKETAIKDGLMYRMGVAKVWWQKDEAEEELTFEGSIEDLAAHMSSNADDEFPADAEMDAEGSISTTLTRKSDTSQVRIVNVPPEEFGASGGSRNLADADLLYHKRKMTPSELLAMGFPWEDVKDLPEGSDWVQSGGEQANRAGYVDGDRWENETDEQSAGRKIEVYECYTKLDVAEGGGKSSRAKRRLWKVFLAGNKVLSKEMVKRQPFIQYTPLPRTHTLWGTSFAARVMPTQNARTTLVRGILDHTVITTNPRYQVLRGGLPNPKELMENRIGGIVNVNKENAVVPLMQAPLNPFVFQTIGMLDEDKEETTGISKLSQGLNKDAISSQNSQGMVEQLVSMSQVRQKVMARRFAEHFLKPLYIEVLMLLVENATKDFWVEVAGNYVQVQPSMMKVRKEVSIDFALGYGEQEKEAQKYLNIFAGIQGIASTDPALSQAFTAQNKYTIITRALAGIGVKDVAAMIGDPSKMPPPPPNPMQALEMQKVQADIAQQTAQAQSTAAKIKREEERDAMHHQMEMMKLQLEMQRMKAQFELDTRKQAHIEAKDAAILRMEAQEMKEDDVKGLIQVRA